MSTATTLVAAMLLDAVFGEPEWLWSRVPHPAVLMGRLVGWCDDRFNAGRRRSAGTLCLIGLTVGAAFCGWLLGLLGPVIEVLVVAVLLAQRSLVQHVTVVADGLRLSLGEGRRQVARIVSRDTSNMHGSSIIRSAIESAAENLSDGVIAPLFWFLIAGLPGLLVYKIVNTADSMIGYRTPRHSEFGWAAARLDDLLNIIPARLTAVLIGVPGGVGNWGNVQADAALHRSPNAGWPEAAMAKALDVSLAGPRTYDGQLTEFPWVHAQGRRDLVPSDIDKAVTILWKAWTVVLLLCGVLTIMF